MVRVCVTAMVTVFAIVMSMVMVIDIIVMGMGMGIIGMGMLPILNLPTLFTSQIYIVALSIRIKVTGSRTCQCM